MLEIRINGYAIKLNEPIHKALRITSLSILNTRGSKKVPYKIAKEFANWIYDLVQRTEGVIEYNCIEVDKNSINPYKVN